MATRVITVAKARGNKDKEISFAETVISDSCGKFFCTYLPATSTKKIKPSIIKDGISGGICSTNLIAIMYKLPPPVRRIL